MFLIVQYCPNDLRENQHYIHNDHKLAVSSLSVYRKTAEEHADRTAYFPFKHILKLPGLLQERKGPEVTAVPKPHPSTKIPGEKAFVDLLRDCPHIPFHTRIILFNLEAERCDNN